MKYPYIVTKNGVLYPAGTEVPEDTDFVVDGKVIGHVDCDAITITDEEVIEETLKDMERESKSYTKTEINRMTTAELRTLATVQGIEKADAIKGAELKKILIEKFEL